MLLSPSFLFFFFRYICQFSPLFSFRLAQERNGRVRGLFFFFSHFLAGGLPRDPCGGEKYIGVSDHFYTILFFVVGGGDQDVTCSRCRSWD